MDKALLDTDVLSEILKGKNDSIIAHAHDYRSQYAFFTTSVITLMEMVKGFQKAGRQDALKKLLSALKGMEILVFEQEAAQLAGKIFGDLERTGQPIGRSDPMIAGIAIARELTLVSGNLSHYQRIQKLGYPLRIDSWH
jgi:tRNA(fMet)-specific endonuclease VapC